MSGLTAGRQWDKISARIAHRRRSKFQRASVKLFQRSENIFSRRQPSRHDVLTGSDPGGFYSTAGGDTTCGNWTKSGDGSAIVGHHDRQGLKDSRHMKSWNSSHGSAGSSQEALVKTGGSGLFYCFAAN